MGGGGNCMTCLGKANLLLGLLFMLLLNGLYVVFLKNSGNMDATEQSLTYWYCVSQKNIFVTPEEVWGI